MSDPTPLESRAAQVRAELIAPNTASRELIEYAVLTVAGLTDLRDRLVTESNAVAARGRRRVTELLAERFGGRRPQLSGWHSLLVFLLTLAPVVPIGLLGSLRLGSTGTEPAAATATAAIGLAQLVVALTVVGKPVARSTLFQSQVSVVLVVGIAAIGAAVTSGALPALFLVGAGGSLVAFVLYIVGRRDADARQRIDDALETAFLDVGAEVASDRERILASARSDLAAAGADEHGLRALRSAAIALLRQDGNPATDDAPDSLPGTYLVIGHTSAWLPPTHRDRGDA